MSSTLKLVMTSVGLALILAAVAGMLLAPNAGALVRSRLENTLTDVFDAPVTIERLALSPLKRSLDLEGVAIANPAGFREGAAFESKRVRLEFDPTTLFARAPVVEDTRVEGAHIYYRHEMGEGINVARLSENADNYFVENGGRRFVFRKVYCHDVEAHFSTNLIPKSRVGLNVVNVTLEDVADAHPITTRAAAAIIFKSIVKEVITLRGLLSSGEPTEAEPL